MADRTVKLSRRRVLGGVAAIAGASAAAGAGTMAYFTDSGSSTDNRIEAGTLTLEFGGSGTFSFTTSLAPTETTSDSVTLENGGTVAGSLDVDVDYTESDATGNDVDRTAQAVAENLEVTTLDYAGDRTGQIDTTNDPPTLHDLATNAQSTGEDVANDLIDLPDPGAGTDFTVEFRLKNVGDDYQYDGVEVDFTFHLNQTDAQ